MNLKNLLIAGLVSCCFALAGNTSLADDQRSPSAEGASISFANLADGDVVPPGFTVRFAVSGMGVAPAGTQVDNTGHFHLLIDLDELPPLDRPLPATEQVIHFGKGQTETTLDLEPGQHLKVDTGHLAAMESTVDFDVTMVKGFRNVLLGGEGLFLASVRGPGKVWLQTMPMSKLAQKIARFMPQTGNAGSKGVNIDVGNLLGGG